MEALEIENDTLQEQNKTLLSKLEQEQKKVEKLYKDAEATRIILQKEIEDYTKTKRQVKAIKKQNKLLKRKLIAKLVNLESNSNNVNNFSVSQGQRSLVGSYLD